MKPKHEKKKLSFTHPHVIKNPFACLTIKAKFSVNNNRLNETKLKTHKGNQILN